MRSLGCIAHSMTDNLLTRAADVVLKERRRLVLMARETPLNLSHIRNMQLVTEMGGIIFPPVPALYQRPQTPDEIITHSVARALDLFGRMSAPFLVGGRGATRTAGERRSCHALRK